MDPVKLSYIGAEIFDAFKKILDTKHPDGIPGHRHLANEEQRFRLWAHSLGLNQYGHASLDYRVRDAIIAKDRLTQILSSLREHLGNLLAIANGERHPFEQDFEYIEDSDSEDSTESETESCASTQSHSRSNISFREVDFRLQSITERIDALYSLAMKIRNPRNRQQRPNDQLYNDISAEDRASYIKEREEAEIAIIAYAQRQQIIEMSPREDADPIPMPEELVGQYVTADHWLIRRTGISNARRRQQFIYWKDHALKLSKAPVPYPSTGSIAEQPGKGTHAYQSVHDIPEQSVTTSATPLPADFMKPGEARSEVSHQSRVSTAINWKGEKFEWPAPPTNITNGQYFICPYCKILCPRRYLNKDAWRVHLIRDLQPYHCTYEDCPGPHQLYGTRQDWINHESQHSRVWHCQTHGEEFITQPEYVEHLKISHPEATPDHFSPELIASVVGPSLKQQRHCPFCPAAFMEIIELEKHVAFHLERCALFALPPIADGPYEGGGHVRSLDNYEV
ncbi:uncharacterized protein F4807DRAFT_227225 [Annulohypoxylon truncatum]|uniref:uncharacterized protein n=1 Tax=Annulohypoxylon truncatum TaxID=327061 RepID=UPI002007C18D|nr:uncharacterized protein F4807DRAFT_227225 [Annulohypoxylon truncatum]KAI1206613.1 hypothetical protein F4807DRAFT_227225 [Annulohypoxylon truncatum]